MRKTIKTNIRQNARQSDEQNVQREEAERLRASPFYAALTRALARRNMSTEELCDLHDAAARRLLAEYGSIFVAADCVRVPPRCVFKDEAAVERFQREAKPRAATLGGAEIELQPAALEAMLAACEEAHAHGLEITPRDGAEAARRTYADTLRLWDSRVRPALEHWSGQSLLDAEEVERIRSLDPSAQVVEVLRLEEQGIFFSKDFSKSILYSVAAPGASQHLAMLAFDAKEFTEARVRELLARHGWFQTVRDDLPHFTFLGVRETDLPALGLRRVDERGQTFWVPRLG
ncbi:MAG: hypothetical protein QOE33_997 [Acidobacteriota bacterium]|nr:hypothetical protein [Acidobacteriota bacterium]